MLCIPYYILYLMGTGHLLLIAIIFFLCIKKERSRYKASYIPFKNEETYFHPGPNYDFERVQKFQDNNLKVEKYNTTENIVSVKRESDMGITTNTMFEEVLETNVNNQGPTVFIPPNVMEQICNAVLNKSKKGCVSVVTDDTESNGGKDDAESNGGKDDAESNGGKHKEEADLNTVLSREKKQCDTNEYDIVPSPKSVHLRISTRLSNTGVHSKDDKDPALRESYYKYPITLKMAYVNANYNTNN
ncbi:unnamed protein product [Euphydryas editha]|uniref:Uncharacterized protein n=1 Tax=Euphydryas editha TaxID=104508 RepID=A0AAU9U3R8_EUPED|nr:unnamed protein product [Euphydryas editha]